MKFPLGWLLFNKMIWMIILSISVIMIAPLVVISLILSIPSPELRGVGTIMIIVGWGAAAGFKDWVLSKRGEERTKPYTFDNAEDRYLSRRRR